MSAKLTDSSTVLPAVPTPAIFAGRRRSVPAAPRTVGLPTRPRLVPTDELADVLTSDAVDAVEFQPGVYGQIAAGQDGEDFEAELHDAVDAALEAGTFRARGDRHELFADGWALVLSGDTRVLLSARRLPRTLPLNAVVASLTVEHVDELLDAGARFVGVCGLSEAQLRARVHAALLVAAAAGSITEDRTRMGFVTYVARAGGLRITLDCRGERLLAVALTSKSGDAAPVPTERLAGVLDSDAVDLLPLPLLQTWCRPGQSEDDLVAEVRDAIDAALESGDVRPHRVPERGHVLRTAEWRLVLSPDAQAVISAARRDPNREWLELTDQEQARFDVARAAGASPFEAIDAIRDARAAAGE